MNDFGSTFTTTGTGVVYDVITNLHSVANLTGDYTSSFLGGFYSDNTNVYIRVHPLSTGTVGTYSLSFHL